MCRSRGITCSANSRFDFMTFACALLPTRNRPKELPLSSTLHVMCQPLRNVVRISADDKPRLPQLLKWRTWGRHLGSTRALAIVKRAIRLNPWPRRRHLHRAAEGGETPHVHHRISALGNGLLGRLGH